ncbi:MAG TPA: hypothetical protein VFI65_16425 [Streptosporangiaceae bacterium]|nr:hypothetical protein [Streptosporangiaceae bacterium]
MLSLFSTVDAIEPSSSARIRTGAWLGSGNITLPDADLLNEAALVFKPEAALALVRLVDQSVRPQGDKSVRPQARQAYLFGKGIQVAGQAEYARQQHMSNLKFAHKTRIATQSGGALGPHPARDPV